MSFKCCEFLRRECRVIENEAEVWRVDTCDQLVKHAVSALPRVLLGFSSRCCFGSWNVRWRGDRWRWPCWWLLTGWGIGWLVCFGLFWLLACNSSIGDLWTWRRPASSLTSSSGPDNWRIRTGPINRGGQSGGVRASFSAVYLVLAALSGHWLG
jgi:hypothetical protein